VTITQAALVVNIPYQMISICDNLDLFKLAVGWMLDKFA